MDIYYFTYFFYNAELTKEKFDVFITNLVDVTYAPFKKDEFLDFFKLRLRDDIEARRKFTEDLPRLYQLQVVANNPGLQYLERFFSIPFNLRDEFPSDHESLLLCERIAHLKLSLIKDTRKSDISHQKIVGLRNDLHNARLARVRDMVASSESDSLIGSIQRIADLKEKLDEAVCQYDESLITICDLKAAVEEAQKEHLKEVVDFYKGDVRDREI